MHSPASVCRGMRHVHVYQKKCHRESVYTTKPKGEVRPKTACCSGPDTFRSSTRQKPQTAASQNRERSKYPYLAVCAYPICQTAATLPVPDCHEHECPGKSDHPFLLKSPARGVAIRKPSSVQALFIHVGATLSDRLPGGTACLTVA